MPTTTSGIKKIEQRGRARRLVGFEARVFALDQLIHVSGIQVRSGQRPKRVSFYYAGAQSGQGTISDFRQRDPALNKVFRLLHPYTRHRARLVALEEQHLRNPFGWVRSWQRKVSCSDLDRDVPFHFRLKRRDVHDDAARVGRFPGKSVKCPRGIGNTRLVRARRTSWAG